jgi:hypothetical protein
VSLSLPLPLHLSLPLYFLRRYTIMIFDSMFQSYNFKLWSYDPIINTKNNDYIEEQGRGQGKSSYWNVIILIWYRYATNVISIWYHINVIIFLTLAPPLSLPFNCPCSRPCPCPCPCPCIYPCPSITLVLALALPITLSLPFSLTMISISYQWQGQLKQLKDKGKGNSKDYISY